MYEYTDPDSFIHDKRFYAVTYFDRVERNRRMGSVVQSDLSSPRDCRGIIGVVVSLLGVLGSLFLLIMYERQIWGFTLLVLFALVGWTSFLWCAVWTQSVPEERTGLAFIGVLVGVIGLGVGLLSVIVYGGPEWSHVLVLLSFVVAALSLLRWGRTGFR